MAIFKSIPAVSTQKDTTSPMKKKPSGIFYEENTEAQEPISDLEADKKLAKIIKPLVDEPDPVVDDDDFVLQEIEKEEKEERRRRSEERKKARALIEGSKEPKKEGVKKKVKSADGKTLTLEERKKLKKAREAKKGNGAKVKTKKATSGTKKAPKKDLSKVATSTKKPSSSSTKTVYHVSKRGETREDRVWKVFIQESNKVIKLFDYQADALEFAKQLAKNKDDGSYVVLHGLDGKIRKI